MLAFLDLMCIMILTYLYFMKPFMQGTHESLKGNTKAKATVGAIIDGMGSLGNLHIFMRPIAIYVTEFEERALMVV